MHLQKVQSKSRICTNSSDDRCRGQHTAGTADMVADKADCSSAAGTDLVADTGYSLAVDTAD